MWAVLIADAGQGTIARPLELDLIQDLFNGKPEVRNAMYDYVLAHASRPVGFDWQGIAQDFGVSEEALGCFTSWEEPDVVVQGVVNAIREARALDLPITFNQGVSLITNVSSVITCDADGQRNALVVTIAAPPK